METFTIWNDRKESSLLWIRGSPGKGKTYLSIFLAEYLASSTDTVLLEYYCDNKDVKRNSASAIIRGFMSGLLNQLPDLSKYLIPVLDKKTGQLRDDSFIALWLVFDRMIRNSEKSVNCILDGLDECDKTSTDDIVGSFGKFFEQPPIKSWLKIALASRPLSKSNSITLAVFPYLSLDQTWEEGPTDIQLDVETFIEAKFDQYFPQDLITEYFDDVPEREAWYSQITAKLVEKAEGTFLWAGFAMEQLKDTNVSDVGTVLKSLPEGLDAMYNRILNQTKPIYQKHIKLLLEWLVVAVEPMSLKELSVAISIEHNEFRHDRIMKDLIDECKGLVVMADNTINLVHQSVKEHLLVSNHSNMPSYRFSVDEKLAHANVARRCISYLQGDCLNISPVVDIDEDYIPRAPILKRAQTAAFPLLSYSIFNWPSHARLSEQNLFGEDNLFFSRESRARKAWQEAYCSLIAYANGEHDDRDYSAQFSSLLDVAAYFDLLILAMQSLNNRKSIPHYMRVNAKGGDFEYPLFLAACNGSVAVARLLIENGADIESGKFNPLVEAVKSSKAIVSLLLEKGAEIESENESGTTPLAAAVFREDLDMVTLLLENGADVNGRIGSKSVPLVEAAFFGNVVITSLLLSKGAKINAKAFRGSTPLISAAREGHLDVVDLLIKEGAAKNVKDDEGKTPLIFATQNGHVAVVALLIKKGATKNLEGEEGKILLSHIMRQLSPNQYESWLEDEDEPWLEDEEGSWLEYEEWLDMLMLILENGVVIDAATVEKLAILRTSYPLEIQEDYALLETVREKLDSTLKAFAEALEQQQLDSQLRPPDLS